MIYSEEIGEHRGDRDPVGEGIDLCHAKVAHLHLPGDQQLVEVPPCGIPVDAGLFDNVGDA